MLGDVFFDNLVDKSADQKNKSKQMYFIFICSADKETIANSNFSALNFAHLAQITNVNKTLIYSRGDSEKNTTFIFFTKWPPAAILDVRNSFSLAFLVISDENATFLHKMSFQMKTQFFFSKWPPAAILDVQN